jgi:hypothetical protein
MNSSSSACTAACINLRAPVRNISVSGQLTAPAKLSSKTLSFSMVAYLLKLIICLSQNKFYQPDTLPSLNASNTRFGYNSMVTKSRSMHPKQTGGLSPRYCAF